MTRKKEKYDIMNGSINIQMASVVKKQKIASERYKGARPQHDK